MTNEDVGAANKRAKEAIQKEVKRLEEIKKNLPEGPHKKELEELYDKLIDNVQSTYIY